MVQIKDPTASIDKLRSLSRNDLNAYFEQNPSVVKKLSQDKEKFFKQFWSTLKTSIFNIIDFEDISEDSQLYVLEDRPDYVLHAKEPSERILLTLAKGRYNYAILQEVLRKLPGKSPNIKRIFTEKVILTAMRTAIQKQGDFKWLDNFYNLVIYEALSTRKINDYYKQLKEKGYDYVAG